MGWPRVALDRFILGVCGFFVTRTDFILRLGMMRINGCCAVVLAGWMAASAAVAGAQGAQTADKTHAIALPAGRVNEYVGQYRDTTEPDVVSSVYLDGDKLFIEGEREPRIELQAESADHFRCAWAASGVCTGCSWQSVGFDEHVWGACGAERCEEGGALQRCGGATESLQAITRAVRR